MGDNSDLANSSLRDLLKICRSHALLLPAQLPEDKHFYVDLIRRHRSAMRQAADSEGQTAADEQPQNRPTVAIAYTAAIAAAATFTQRSPVRSDSSISSSSSSSSSISASSSSSDLLGREGYVRVSAADALPPLSSSPSAAASSSSFSSQAQEGKEGQEAALDDMEVVEGADGDYEDEEEQEFARSPAVQRITNVLQNIGPTLLLLLPLLENGCWLLLGLVASR